MCCSVEWIRRMYCLSMCVYQASESARRYFWRRKINSLWCSKSHRVWKAVDSQCSSCIDVPPMQRIYSISWPGPTIRAYQLVRSLMYSIRWWLWGAFIRNYGIVSWDLKGLENRFTQLIQYQIWAKWLWGISHTNPQKSKTTVPSGHLFSQLKGKHWWKPKEERFESAYGFCVSFPECF